MKGLDSEGRNMPPYANEEYGYEKFTRNPSNRGYWDLKNTGQYHSGIRVKITASSVHFTQHYKNRKVAWIDKEMRAWGLKPLGITQEQWAEVNEEVARRVREDINKILSSV